MRIASFTANAPAPYGESGFCLADDPDDAVVRETIGKGAFTESFCVVRINRSSL